MTVAAVELFHPHLLIEMKVMAASRGRPIKPLASRAA